MKFKQTLILFAWLSISLPMQAKFSNLAQLQEYAQSTEEYPDVDNDNLLKPDYQSFYKKNLPNWFGTILRKLGIKKPLLWDVYDFKNILEQVTQDRENNGLNGRFVQKIEPKPGTKFIVWQGVHGAFHSLVRDLTELKRLDFINEHLEIIKDNCFFVFNGDSINLSPYNLETFTLVLSLMKINPKKVIYIRGEHEDKEHWYNFGLRQELEIRAEGLSSESIPLSKTVNRFFNTLPLALYLVSREKDSVNVVRIAHHDRKYTELNEEEFDDFFHKESELEIDSFNLKNKKPSTKPVDIKALIKSEERSTSFTQHEGLLALDPDQGATAWTILSSPIRSHRTLYKFFYDAFTIITTHESIDQWTIALYNRDVRDLVNFKKSAEYYLISGREIVAKKVADQEKKLTNQIDELKKELDKTTATSTQLKKELEQCKTAKESTSTTDKKDAEAPKPATVQAAATSVSQAPKKQEDQSAKGDIVIGTSQDLSKYMKVESVGTQLGITLAFDRANREGGVHGRKLKLITLDDEFNPEFARRNVEQLLTKHNCDIILLSMGSRPFQGYLELVKQKKVLALFPSTGDAGLRNPDLKYLIHFRSSYDAMHYTLVRYGIDQVRIKKLAIVYPIDSSTATIKEQVERAVKNDIEYKMISYDPGNPDLKPQAKQVLDYNPGSLLLLTTSRPSQELLRLIGAQNLLNKPILAEESGDLPFKTFLKENGLINQFYDAENVPNPAASQLEIMKEYREEMDNRTPEIYSAEAFVQASFFVDRLRAIQGEITKESIIEIMENTKDYKFKGIFTNFNMRTRELSPNFWIDTGKPEWIHVPVKYEEFLPAQETKTEIQAKPIEPKKATPREQSTKAAGPQKPEGDIIIGTTMDFSKTLKKESDAAYMGINLAIKQANNEGGIDGRQIKIVALDDEYDPKKAKENIQTLIDKHNTNVILYPMASNTLLGYFDMVKDGKILIVFPSTGNVKFHDPAIKNIINFRLDYSTIDRELLKYLIKQGSKKFAFFYPLDESSEGTEEDIKSVNLKKNDYISATYKPGTTDFKEQAAQTLKFDPDTIVLWGTSRTSTEFLRQIGIEKLTAKKIAGVELGDNLFKTFIKEQGLAKQFIDTQNLPNPETSTLEIAQEYRKAMGNKPLDIFSFEGYVNTEIFIDLLKRTKGPITTQSIIETAENTKNYMFKGLKLNFDPSKRNLSRYLWLDKGDKDWEIIEVQHDAPTTTKKSAPQPPLPEEKTTAENPKIANEKTIATSEVKQPESTDAQAKSAEPKTPTSSEEPTKAAKTKQPEGDIVIGTTMDFSKTLKTESDGTILGLNLAIKEINAAGGIDGQPIKLISLDDEFDPTIAKKNIETLLSKHKTDIIVSPMAAKPLMGYLDMVKENKVLVVFPSTGSSTLRDPNTKSMLHWRRDYSVISQELIKYLMKTGSKKFVFFYPTDESAAGLEKDVTATGLKKGDYQFISYKPGSTDFKEQAKKIVQFQPDTIIQFGSSRPFSELIRQLGNDQLVGKRLAGTELGDELFKSFLKEQGLEKQFIDTQNLPNPRTSTLEIAEDYRKAMGNKPLDIFSFEGYVSGMIFAEILKRAQKPLTKETIIKAAEEINNTMFKGLKLNFDPSTRTLSDYIWLDTGEKEWIALDISKKASEQPAAPKTN